MSNNGVPIYSTILFTDVWDEVSKFKSDFAKSPFAGSLSATNPDNVSLLFYLLYAKYGNNPIANFDVNQWKFKLFSVIFQYGPTWEKKLAIQETLRGLQLDDLINDGAIDELFNHSGLNGVTESTTGSLNKETTNTGTQTIAHTGTVGVVHDNDITNSGSDTTVANHAFNPGTAPSGSDAYAPLTYINEQNAQKLTKGTMSAQDESSTTTYANTDTTTNNLAGQEASNTTGSRTVSGNDSVADTRKRTLTRGKLTAYEHLIRLLDSDITGDFLIKFRICFKQFVAPEKPLVYIEDPFGDEDQ